MVRAIVFDIGGVLIDLDLDSCRKAFLDILGYQRITELLDPSHQRGIYGDMEAGLLSADEFRAAVLSESRPGSRPEDVDLAMAALLVRMHPGVPELLRRLAPKVSLYLLSNNNPISMQRTYALMRGSGVDPEKTFRGAFISCDMKLMKPSPGIFAETVRRIGLPAGDILFIDDSLTNVEAARRSGMQARHFAKDTDLSALIPDF